jgi:hypothetical protein
VRFNLHLALAAPLRVQKLADQRLERFDEADLTNGAAENFQQ